MTVQWLKSRLLDMCVQMFQDLATSGTRFHCFSIAMVAQDAK